MKRIFSKKNKFYFSGFTLIELLVVISIIGLLSTMALISIDVARVKTRNVKRKSDVRLIIKAINFYADDNGGVYPASGDSRGTWDDPACVGLDGGKSCFDGTYSGYTSFKNAISPYIENAPADPIRKNQNFDRYLYSLRCHETHLGSSFTSPKPCVYWLPEGTVSDETCDPGRQGSSGSAICGVECDFCTMVVE